MTRVESVLVTAQTFGRDGAMFESLLGFVAQLSLLLWGLVIFTAVIRFVGIRIYRRGAAGTAPAATVASSAAVPSAAAPATLGGIGRANPAAGQLSDAGLARLGPFGSTAAEKDAVLVPVGPVDVVRNDAVKYAKFDEALQPAGVAASVKLPRRAARNRRSEHRSAANVPALASNSREA